MTATPDVGQTSTSGFDVDLDYGGARMRSNTAPSVH